MSKAKILVCDGMDADIFEKLCAHPQLQVYPKAKNSQEEIAKLCPDMHGLIIRSATTCDADFLARCPQLRYIIRAGEGTDNIDKDYCRQKNIAVSNTPGANNNSAAEHAIALMFTLLRHTAQANAEMQQGIWNKSAHSGLELTGKTLGIVGMGRIGQLVAQRLSGFQLKTYYYDPFLAQSDLAQKTETLEELLELSDIVTLHLPKSPETENLFTLQQFEKMKKSSYLINAARGKIVNEADLLNALQQGLIAGAALDVFAQEPLAKDSPLVAAHPNLILTPHLGASTSEAAYRVGEKTLEQIVAFFVEDKLINSVL